MSLCFDIIINTFTVGSFVYDMAFQNEIENVLNIRLWNYHIHIFRGSQPSGF